MTQVLTGYGMFGEYLRKIGREMTDIYHYCREDRDTAQHTMELCPARQGAIHPAARHRRKIDPLGDFRSDVERATGIRCCPPLLQVMLAKEQAQTERIEKLSPL